MNPSLCRLVWSESDGLPGVIIDRYGDHLVLQTLTLAMDQRKALIIEALTKLSGDVTIIERNDAAVRRQRVLALTEILVRLSGLTSVRARDVSQLLWDEVAEIELGWRWHDIGPDGALCEAQRLLAANSGVA